MKKISCTLLTLLLLSFQTSSFAVENLATIESPDKGSYSEITINAPMSTVWNILNDFSQYSDWHTTIDSVEVTSGNNPAEVGDELLMVTPPLPFPLPVSLLAKTYTNSHAILIWGNNDPLLLKVQHQFELTSINNGQQTLVKQSEVFLGLLSGLVPQFAIDIADDAFIENNAAIKTRAEAMPAANNSLSAGNSGGSLSFLMALLMSSLLTVRKKYLASLYS